MYNWRSVLVESKCAIDDSSRSKNHSRRRDLVCEVRRNLGHEPLDSAGPVVRVWCSSVLFVVVVYSCFFCLLAGPSVRVGPGLLPGGRGLGAPGALAGLGVAPAQMVASPRPRPRPKKHMSFKKQLQSSKDIKTKDIRKHHIR